MSCDRFRGSPRPTLGVELELQIVDAGSMALRDAAGDLLEGAPAPLAERVKAEFHACCVEVNTGVCRDVAEVGRDLDHTLRALEGLAAGRGLRLAWGGSHPFSHWRDRAITPDPRYRELAERFRETLCRQLTFGMHVHVGVPSGDAAVRVCGRLREFLPALLALSANSPFWCGRATGLRAHRIEVLAASPVNGFPPQLDSWDGYRRLVDGLIGCGAIQSPKDLWWDARPSPELGTVELRVCDMPADLDTVLALSAVTQCLVHTLCDEPGPAAPGAEFRDVVARENRWRAARFGLGAGLIDPDSGRSEPAARVVRRLADRLQDVASGLGCSDELDLARDLAGRPTGADRLLAVHRETNDLVAVARRMVDDASRDFAHSGPPASGTHRLGPSTPRASWTSPATAWHGYAPRP